MMIQTKAEMIKEIEFQSQMLKNLKKWIRTLIILSSLMVVLVYWALGMKDGLCYNIIGGIGILFMIASIIICAIIGLAFKRGKENVIKITTAL